MKDELKKLVKESEIAKKENAIFFKRLKKQNKRSLDHKFHQLHVQAFQQIDCLDCANCCKTTSPIFTLQDIKRLAKLFKMKERNFIQEYLRLDDENDYVLQSSPCPFLNEDHTCFIYDVRPQACREYPHTDRKNMYQILSLTQKNTLVCPAVSSIVKQMKNDSI